MHSGAVKWRHRERTARQGARELFTAFLKEKFDYSAKRNSGKKEELATLLSGEGSGVLEFLT